MFWENHLAPVPTRHESGNGLHFAGRYLNQSGRENLKDIDCWLIQFHACSVRNPLYISRFLTDEYVKHCVPSTLSSGLASLPLKHVFMDGKQTGNLTTMLLPDGTRLDGKKAYEMIVSYYTTSDITPQDISDLGEKRLEDLYKQVNNTY